MNVGPSVSARFDSWKPIKADYAEESEDTGFRGGIEGKDGEGGCLADHEKHCLGLFSLHGR